MKNEISVASVDDVEAELVREFPLDGVDSDIKEGIEQAIADAVKRVEAGERTLYVDFLDVWIEVAH